MRKKIIAPEKLEELLRDAVSYLAFTSGVLLAKSSDQKNLVNRNMEFARNVDELLN